MNNKALNILIIEDDVAACRELSLYIEKIDEMIERKRRLLEE